MSVNISLKNTQNESIKESLYITTYLVVNYSRFPENIIPED